MLYIFRLFSTRLFLIVFLYTTGSCNSKGDKIIPAYNNYKFDQKIIEKLPVYDSLASTILGKINLFQDSISNKDSYQAFRYIPNSNEPKISQKLPAEVNANINRYITKLGKDFFYGFDIFKDSTMKIYVRRKIIEKTKVEIEENLSFYPIGRNLRHRDYPIKDTILNIHWQYWVRFDAPGLF